MIEDNNKKQNLIEWEFHIHVSTNTGYCEGSIIVKAVGEEEYRLLEEGRVMHLEVKYNAGLADIYDEV